VSSSTSCASTSRPLILAFWERRCLDLDPYPSQTVKVAGLRDLPPPFANSNHLCIAFSIEHSTTLSVASKRVPMASVNAKQIGRHLSITNPDAWSEKSAPQKDDPDPSDFG
jgi:hypothetical protein